KYIRYPPISEQVKRLISHCDVTMESGRFIVFTEQAETSQNVTVIFTEDPEHPIILPITCNSAKMHPQQQILAVLHGRELKIFDIDKQPTVKKTCIQEEEVVFWRWIDDYTIGVVTQSTVYHWDFRGDSKPMKIFKRHDSLNGCRIIDYRGNEGLKSLVLIGEHTQGGRTTGWMQLLFTGSAHLLANRLSHPMAGDCACFVEYTMQGNAHPTDLFVSSRRNEEGGKLVIMEVGTRAMGNKPYSKKSVDVNHTQV
ncbi:hypothetical protein PMAYCL1PPCAC_00787, partial [Pristionchus mayeri]